VTAISELLTPDQRERLAERLAQLRELATLMREPARPSERDGQDDKRSADAP
jgi:hypothetical protein